VSGMTAAWMFPALFALVFLGVPVGFALMSVAFTFGWLFFGNLIGTQGFRFLYDIASTYVLAAIPLFIFMGAMLERSGIAQRLFQAMRLWLGGLPGGLSIATIAMCAVFAAGTGIVGAVEALVGLMAIPAMMRVRYDKGLIAGTICAGGSLGTIIPPSIVVVIYATSAQLSIGRMFAGILIPGVLMVVFFVLYILLRCWWRPADGPPAPREERAVPLAQKLWVTLTALLPALALVVAVIGSILAGIASPTEAAGVGALGTILLSALYRTLNRKTFLAAVGKTLEVNAMIMFIVVGGTMFTSIFRAHGGNRLVAQLVEYLALGPGGTITLFLLILFVLGFVLDWVSVVLICIPIFVPILRDFGVDPLWFGIMAIVVIQTSYLTPPMAPAIFYLRAIAPPEMTYADMYRGVAPFVLCQGAVLFVVAMIPGAATYLPARMVGF
jgi:tripartite ATP-independent transporter DctM subunit